MRSEPSSYSFNDRALTQTLHGTLLRYFCNAFDGTIAQQLADCQFGFAPSPVGEPTFFIVAPSREEIERLSSEVDRLVHKVADLMPGMRKLALCCQPPSSRPVPNPGVLCGRVFSVPQLELDTNSD
ncbi:hypothetical protein NEA10_20115 [Phormidium yuhuli AB48]|uniref:Uncharacterized protein n=1 Tax=Phormidium yuhuli AB48 TaxID=2940671 RepID=A0ABY5AQQ3_9CYAN|nr:hypothetical protein [Phormidium yuhuli]USR91101.1 hypothetical protein NEA10_20115 [Phormidium yuhuli AB48]